MSPTGGEPTIPPSTTVDVERMSAILRVCCGVIAFASSQVPAYAEAAARATSSAAAGGQMLSTTSASFKSSVRSAAGVSLALFASASTAGTAPPFPRPGRMPMGPHDRGVDTDDPLDRHPVVLDLCRREDLVSRPVRAPETGEPVYAAAILDVMALSERWVPLMQSLANQRRERSRARR